MTRLLPAMESIGHGIGDTNDETGALGLPQVEPTFSWGIWRSVPVRIHIDTLPAGWNGSPVCLATISVIPDRTRGAPVNHQQPTCCPLQ